MNAGTPMPAASVAMPMPSYAKKAWKNDLSLPILDSNHNFSRIPYPRLIRALKNHFILLYHKVKIFSLLCLPSSILEILTRHVHTIKTLGVGTSQWREYLHSRNIIFHNFRIKNEQEKCGKPDPGNGQTRWIKVCVLF
jgi:hypothetical protein